MAAYYQTLNDVFADVRYNAAKDQYTLTDADLLRIANKYYLYIVRELASINEGIYGQISHTDLQANQSEYILPIDDVTGDPPNAKPYGGGLISIIRVESSYDGTNWFVHKNISVSQIDTQTTLTGYLDDQYTKSSPVFWFFDRSIFIAPVPTASDNVGADTGGLFIWWIQRPAELGHEVDDAGDPTLGEEPNLPKDYLSALTEGMLIDVFRKFGRMNDMRIAEDRFYRYMEVMKKNESDVDMNEPLYLQSARKRYS